jgi:uncharacterized protein
MKDFPAAYQSTEGSALQVDKAFYSRVADDIDGRRLTDSVVIPIRTARAWKVPAGHVFRIVALEGPQVGDLNMWNLHNPRERLWASRTRQLQAAHVTTFDRLWSTLPYLRPMATITADSLASYGVDEYGGRVHDLLGTRCDQPHADGRGFRFLLPLQPDAGGCAARSHRARCPRRPQCLPMHRAQPAGQVFHAREPGAAG